jgi:hypothetical protein
VNAFTQKVMMFCQLPRPGILPLLSAVVSLLMEPLVQSFILQSQPSSFWFSTLLSAGVQAAVVLNHFFNQMAFQWIIKQELGTY